MKEYPALAHPAHTQCEGGTLRCVLDRLGEQTPEHACGVDRERQRAGERTQAGGD